MMVQFVWSLIFWFFLSYLITSVLSLIQNAKTTHSCVSLLKYFGNIYIFKEHKLFRNICNLWSVFWNCGHSAMLCRLQSMLAWLHWVGSLDASGQTAPQVNNPPTREPWIHSGSFFTISLAIPTNFFFWNLQIF